MTETFAAEAAPNRHFDAILTPNRSLPRWGFWLVILTFAGGLSAVGFGFWMLGAWPVAGFCGLEVFLVWGAFELNYRAGRMFERIVLDDVTLSVHRVSARGSVTRWSFEPGWVRVVVEQPGEEDCRLLVTSHGRSVVLGRFLSPEERVEVGEALGAAIARWRAVPAGV